jgi:hypothetical protein
MKTLKTIAALGVGISVLLGLVAAAPNRETKWLGELAYWKRLPSKPYPAFEHVIGPDGERKMETGPQLDLQLEEVEVGLRSDGVLVWRAKK